MSTRRAVVLLSGGLDSATVLAQARSAGWACHALSVHYGQRHSAELAAAARVAQALGAVEHRVMGVDLAGIGGSALTDPGIAVPESPATGIPSTYVPARNTLLLALALGWAEVLDAEVVFVGVNAVDYSGYPDCRPAFVAAFNEVARLRDRGSAHGGARAVGGDDQGADHPERHRARCRLCDDGILLPGRRGGGGLRPLRVVPVAARGFRCCRRP
jgi:7-cyano-7-deazaguanine synthase